MSRWILDSPLDVNVLLQETEDPSSGALIVFYGTVRNENEGQPVNAMTYEAHVNLAEKVLEQIEEEAVKYLGARRVRIQHRIGKLMLGEPSVLVVVRAAHRAEAYAASRFAIDELKQRAPIWKEEHYVSGGSRYLDGTPLKKDEPKE